uniref:Uncharacterized protein n=1 Tax=Arundo donax TaxID=35708 RepID=A0A0A9FJU5_ARUDO
MMKHKECSTHPSQTYWIPLKITMKRCPKLYNNYVEELLSSDSS